MLALGRNSVLCGLLAHQAGTRFIMCAGSQTWPKVMTGKIAITSETKAMRCKQLHAQSLEVVEVASADAM